MKLCSLACRSSPAVRPGHEQYRSSAQGLGTPELKDRQKSTCTYTHNFGNHQRDSKDYQRSSMDLLRSKLNVYFGITRNICKIHSINFQN